MYYIYVEKDVKIAVHDLNPEAEKTIVLIHGWPLSCQMYEYQIHHLIGQGYRVITFDLRGFGKSDIPAIDYTYDRMATDLHKIIEALKIEHFTLVGFSTGGAIACRYMGLFNGVGVQKLCLLAATAPRFTQTEDFQYGVPKVFVNNLIIKTSLDRPQSNEDFCHMLFDTPHSSEIKIWFKNMCNMSSSIGTINTAYSLMNEDCRQDITNIAVPTGIFHGQRDRLVPYQLAEVLHNSIPGSTLYSFEKSGHAVFYDELNKFNDAFFKFLD